MTPRQKRQYLEGLGKTRNGAAQELAGEKYSPE